MALNRPNQLTTAFANAGLKNDIPQSATGSNLASYEEGFPVITMQAIADGGMPPQGQDFNGMFYTLTDIARYAQAGGLYPFDKEFCTAIGGYPLGAILTSLDGAKLYINQVNGNTNNPDTNSTNWQTVLTSTLLDAVPTADSTNPVASNGVFDALATKQNTLTFDNAPTSGSINPVTSGGIKTALDAKQDTLTFDSTPTADSNNPVTSQGIKAAIDAKDSLPSQTGHAGEYLKTDGETASWSNVESLPSQTGQAGKVLTTDGEKASWEYGSVGHHILEIFMTSRTDPAPINGAYDCNGAWYNKSDFTGENNPYDMLVAGKAHTCTDAEYEDELNQKGSCGKYVVDTANQRFRVPTINNILQPTVLASAIGEICDAGLPNITGGFDSLLYSTTYALSIGLTSGSFYVEKTKDTDDYIETSNISSNNNGHRAGRFDASRSSPVYGKSTTVQPQTIKVRPMVQLATAGQEISIEQYEQQLSEYARTNTLNGRLIGEIIQSALPLTDAGVHLLDGSQIQKSGIYAQFCTYVANLQADYPDLFCTEAEFTASVEAYGSCGKFVNGASYIRLPKVSDILQGTTDVTAVGDLIEAGLPNITGKFIGGNANGTISGAFKLDGNSISSQEGSRYHESQMSFDASRSSSIYGKSTTVQPQTIKALLYICVATAVKTQIQVDIDNIATDLNGKADRDLSNATAPVLSAPYVVETWRDGTSWYRKWSDGLIEQGGRAKATNTITYYLPFSDTSYSLFLQSCKNGAFSTVKSLTVTSFTSDLSYGSDSKDAFWYACGY